MLNISKMIKWLKNKTKWQETPYPLNEEDYFEMIREGIELLFVETGRSADYDEDKYVIIEETGEYGFDYTIPLDEKKFIQYSALINFFAKVQTDYNDRFGYTTDALTVTNANKPYENLRETIDKLDNERRIIYYKMIRYTLT